MYHLTMANVPQVVHVPQVGNPCLRLREGMSSDFHVVVLALEVLILITVTLGELIDADAVLLKIVQYLQQQTQW